MSKQESEEPFIYTGPSAIEIRDEEGNVLVSPTITIGPKDYDLFSGNLIRFVNSEGKLIGATYGEDPDSW